MFLGPLIRPNANQLSVQSRMVQIHLTCSLAEPEDSNSKRILAHSVDQGINRSSKAISKATVSNGTSKTGIVKKMGARVVQKASLVGKDLALNLSVVISSRTRAKVLSRTAEKGFSGDKSW